MEWHLAVEKFAARHVPEKDQEWRKTEKIKLAMQQYLAVTPGKNLSAELFNQILDWKLRRQRGRTESKRERITSEMLSSVTACALNLKHEDSECLAEVRLKLLSALPGVGLGLASAILTLAFPREYAVIDFRVWQVMFQEEKRTFTPGDYKKYLKEMRRVAGLYKWPVQKLDYFAWAYYEELANGKTGR